MSDCLFCKIVAGEIPAERVLEKDDVIAFRDINPQAPVHLLVIPKKHIATLDDLAPEETELGGNLLRAASEAAAAAGLAEKGYRTVINCGRDAGQEVFHIHLHVLGGRGFRWPPG